MHQITENYKRSRPARRRRSPGRAFRSPHHHGYNRHEEAEKRCHNADGVARARPIARQAHDPRPEHAAKAAAGEEKPEDRILVPFMHDEDNRHGTRENNGEKETGRGKKSRAPRRAAHARRRADAGGDGGAFIQRTRPERSTKGSDSWSCRRRRTGSGRENHPQSKALSAAPASVPPSPPSSLPLDRRRRLRGNVVHDPPDALHPRNDGTADPVKKIVRQARPLRRHRVP